jgi:ABC-type dipeptide/oligopeptide/nickel transport system permease component
MVRKQLGLDQPLPVQYGRWLSGILKGDLGKSFMSKKPVVEELCARFPATLALAVSAMTLLMLVCLPLGIGSAMYPGSMLDRIGRSISFLTVSIPSFWLGLLLLYVFGARLKWIPVAGGTGPASVLLPAPHGDWLRWRLCAYAYQYAKDW